jgi:hypothetical protein
MLCPTRPDICTTVGWRASVSHQTPSIYSESWSRTLACDVDLWFTSRTNLLIFAFQACSPCRFSKAFFLRLPRILDAAVAAAKIYFGSRRCSFAAAKICFGSRQIDSQPQMSTMVILPAFVVSLSLSLILSGIHCNMSVSLHIERRRLVNQLNRLARRMFQDVELF